MQKSVGELKTLTDSLNKIGEKGAEKGLVEFVTNLQKQADKLDAEVTRIKNEGGQKAVTFDTEMERLFKSEDYQKWTKGEKAMMGNKLEVKAITVASTANSFTRQNRRAAVR